MALRCMIALVLALCQSAPAHAFEAFETAALAPEELDSMRGGFLLAGGMTIDFAIIRQSMVNGEMQTQSTFSSQGADLSLLNSEQFRTMVDVGGLNTEALNQVSGLVTVIQNSADNALIQNLHMMDVTVQNTQAQRNANTLAPLRDMYMFNHMR